MNVVRYEYEYLLPPIAQGMRPEVWRRASFAKRQDLGYPSAPTIHTDAWEMLQVIAPKWKPGTKLRLLRITEEIDDEVLTVGQ